MKKILITLIMGTVLFANPINSMTGNMNQMNMSSKQLFGHLQSLTMTNPYVEYANFMLGLYYLAGDPAQGIKQDYIKAMDYFKKDAANLAMANYKIAEMYYFGLGIKKDTKTAMQWFLKAIDGEFMDSKQATPIANAAIGTIYLNELKDPKKAYPYLLNSAQDGNLVDAQIVLAFMYAKGDGIKQNWDEADYWLNKAWTNKAITPEQKKSLIQFIEKAGQANNTQGCTIE